MTDMRIVQQHAKHMSRSLNSPDPKKQSGSAEASVKVEEGDNFPQLLGLLASFKQQVAIMEGKADYLLHTVYNVPIADPT